MRNSSPPEADDDVAERLFVIATWLAMTVALAWFVGSYGRNLAYMEDWDLVPVLAGHRAFGVGWLLEQTVEHRYVLAKALLYPIWLASGGDFRSSMAVDAALLAALALGFILVARALRGRTAFADAFFPLVLLHWGHAETLVFFLQICFVLPVVLVSGAALLIATRAWERSRLATVALAGAIALLPLNGAMGLLLAPPLAVWAVYAAWARRRGAAWLAVASAATALLSALYFVGYRAAAFPRTVARTPTGTISTTLEALSIAVGPAGAPLWPVSGALALAVGLAAAYFLARAIVRRPEDRTRAAGLGAALAATGLLAAGIGFGRAIGGPGAGFSARYALLLAPMLCFAFVAAVLYAGPRAGRFLQVALFAFACAAVGPNLEAGLEYGRFRASLADALQADLDAGLPPEVLAQRYAAKIYPPEALLAERLEMLRAARLGPYRNAPEPSIVAGGPFRQTPVPISVAGAHEVTIDGGVVRGTGADPYVIYSLPGSTFVYGVRLRYSVSNDAGVPPEGYLFWRRSGETDFDGPRNGSPLDVVAPPGERVETVWVYDVIDTIRIDPDVRPCELRLSEIVLLTRE